MRSEGTICRPAVRSCDQPEMCDGLLPFCREAKLKPPSSDCIPTAEEIGPADVACLNKNGQCNANGDCTPVRLKPCTFCVPSDIDEQDLRCVNSTACDGSARCKAEFLQDGQQCGNFCDNTSCVGHVCLPNPGTHPCGAPEFCNPNPTTRGKECKDCGDGMLQPWEGEECDDGNNEDGDGCTAHCKFACNPQNPVSCPQPTLSSGIHDPCRRTECE